MAKFTFHMGVNARCYGNVEAEADTIEQAVAMLTADYVGENIEPGETTWDSLTDMAIIDVRDENDAEIATEFDCADVPSEYDRPPFPPSLALAQEGTAGSRIFGLTVEPTRLTLELRPAPADGGHPASVAIEIEGDRIVVIAHDPAHDAPVTLKIGAAGIEVITDDRSERRPEAATLAPDHYLKIAKEHGAEFIKDDMRMWRWVYEGVSSHEIGVGPFDTDEEAAQDLCLDKDLEAKPVIRTLRPEELDAITSYAADHGVAWKGDLQIDWYNARAIGDRGAILHALRNDPRWGHEGLEAFELPAGGGRR